MMNVRVVGKRWAWPTTNKRHHVFPMARAFSTENRRAQIANRRVSTAAAGADGESGGNIELLGDGRVLLRNVVLDSKHLHEYLELNPDDSMKASVEKATEIGSYCLLKTTSMSSSAMISNALQAHLETQVNQAVQSLLSQTSRVTDAKLSEVKGLLSSELDTSKKNSSLGKALGQMHDLLDRKRQDSVPALFQKGLEGVAQLLDERRADSIPAVFRSSLSEATSVNGTIAKAVRVSVDEALTPLRETVDKMGQVVLEQKAAKAALMDKSALKGVAFEEELLATLNTWKRTFGATIEWCGPDNQPGDILVRINGATDEDGLLIVVEAKDTSSNPMGRLKAGNIIRRAIGSRGAQCGILIGKDQTCFGQDVGDWDEGFEDDVHWVACTPDHLLTSLRYIVMMHQIKRAKERGKSDGQQIDTQVLQDKLGTVRTHMKKSAQIKRKSTDIKKNADAIKELSTDIEQQVITTIGEIEFALGLVNIIKTKTAAKKATS